MKSHVYYTKLILKQIDGIEDKKIRLMGLTLKKSDAESDSLSMEAIQLKLDFDE